MTLISWSPLALPQIDTNLHDKLKEARCENSEDFNSFEDHLKSLNCWRLEQHSKKSSVAAIFFLPGCVKINVGNLIQSELGPSRRGGLFKFVWFVVLVLFLFLFLLRLGKQFLMKQGPVTHHDSSPTGETVSADDSSLLIYNRVIITGSSIASYWVIITRSSIASLLVTHH